MRVAVTGAGRPARAGARHRARGVAVHRAVRAARLDAADLRPRRAGRGSRRCSTATAPRSSSTPPHGPTSTAAPGTRSWRWPGTDGRRLRSRSRPRPAGSTWSSSRRTRSSTADGRTAWDTGRTTPRTRSMHTALPSWRARRARGPPTLSAPVDGPALGIVRTAWLFGPPGADFPTKILAAADRALAAGEPLRLVVRRDGLADGRPRPRRSDRRADRWRGDRGHPPRRECRDRESRRVGTRGPPPGSRGRSDRGRPFRDMAAAVDAARVGRPRADAAAGRRAAPILAAGSGRPDARPAAGPIPARDGRTLRRRCPI